MGIFSSKLKTYVGTSVSRVSNASQFISSKKRGFITGFNRNQDTTEHTLNYLTKSHGFNAKRVFNYANSSYIFGRPNDTIFSKSGSDAVTSVAINNYLTGIGATKIYYSVYGLNNYFHKAYTYLFNNYAYNFDTNEIGTLSIEKGVGVYLKEITILISDNVELPIGNLKKISLHPCNFEIVNTVLNVGLKISYSYFIFQNNTLVLVNESRILSTSFQFADTNDISNYFCAAYKDSNSNTAFPNYKENTGIPYLDNIYSTNYSVAGDYYPRIYFRWNYESGSKYPSSTEYLHSKEIAKKIGLAYDQVVEAVHKIDADRTQADLDKIISSVFMYALPADATEQTEIMYLFKHFEKWYNVVNGTISNKSLSSFNSTLTLSELNEHVTVIADARFKITVGMQGIWKRTVSGTVADVGKYHTTKGTLTVSEYSEEYDYLYSYVYPWNVYRYQVEANQYIEYQIAGLECKYYIIDDYHSYSVYTEDVNNPTDLMYVPLDYTIVSSLNVFTQEELMYKAMHIFNNSVEVVKVKWYQRNGWATAFKIGAIILALQGFTEALAFIDVLVAVASVSIAWAIEIISALVLDAVFLAVSVNVFVNTVGDDLAFLTAIFLMVNGAWQGNVFGFNLGTASELLSYSNSIFAEINKNISKEIKSIQEEYLSFEDKSNKELTEISSLLEDPLNSNVQMGKLLLAETPDMFFTKTHQGNIGTKAYDLLHNFVDISLNLPRSPTIRI